MSPERVPMDVALKKSKKEYSDPNYYVKYSQVKEKLKVFVPKWPRPDSSDSKKKAATEKKIAPKYMMDICTKGTTECRHSNNRMEHKIALLSHFSPKVEDM